MVRLVELEYIPSHIIDFDREEFLTKCDKNTIYSSSKGTVIWACDASVASLSEILHQKTNIPLYKLEDVCRDCTCIDELIDKLDSGVTDKVNLDNETYIHIKNYKAKTINDFPYTRILSMIGDVKIKYSEIQYSKVVKLYIVSPDYTKFYITLENLLVNMNILNIENIIERKKDEGSVFLDAYITYDGITFRIKIYIVHLSLHPLANVTFMKPDLDISVINNMTSDDIVGILGYDSPKHRTDVEKLVNNFGLTQ